jgi:hypothetical protein
VFVELLLEAVLYIIAEILGELSLRALSRLPWTREPFNAIVTLIMYLGVGVVIGFISILIFPKAFVRSSQLHGISLFVTPVLGGFVMSFISWVRVRGDFLVRLETFACGFVFAFGMALIRLLFTT